MNTSLLGVLYEILIVASKMPARMSVSLLADISALLILEEPGRDGCFAAGWSLPALSLDFTGPL